ncbi:c-type cytochrome [Pusillimonas sp. ANT_WB101]|uniref:c-type cytochrome n=1 Tax=Pusillimonas sp. ANT_WB101 TaxID=2597356 RepID=UPI0011EF2AC7|nr:c-type cytochrome [Pusillimonas sp. ANT_WB101]KAA0890913.1 c-type cytochrome [Pusillimonas sp. ANT_WB101]
MRILPLAVILLAMSTTAGAADIKADAAAGATKAAVCLACHGGNGAKPLAPIYPSLAGQSNEYLVSSLHAYRDGLRQGGMAAMMTPQAALLSDQDIADLAAYYSEQNPGATPK